MELDILYEDNHLIVVMKPAGIITQRDSTGRLSLLDMVKEYIREKYDKPGEVFLGAVHRLDRTVSGPVLFARTSKAAGRLFDEFKQRRVLKLYAALVHAPSGAAGRGDGLAEWTTLSHHLERKRDTTKIAAQAGDRTKEASLRYTVLSRDERYALLLIHLLTGRKHQIRAQLAAIGCPVVGDVHYGSAERTDPDAISLHSCYLRFNHPTLKVPVVIHSALPERITARLAPPVSIDEIVARTDWDGLS